MTDDSVMSEMLAQLLYLNTNVWWCTILQKDCLIETVSLLQLWDDKRFQHFVIRLNINGARFGSCRSDGLKKE